MSTKAKKQASTAKRRTWADGPRTRRPDPTPAQIKERGVPAKCPNGHAMASDPANVYMPAKGKGRCRTCINARLSAAAAAKHRDTSSAGKRTKNSATATRNTRAAAGPATRGSSKDKARA